MSTTTATARTSTGTPTVLATTADAAAASQRTPRPRRGQPAPALPLGSLTQLGHAPSGACPSCGSASVTALSMTLTDGTPAMFSSCRTCGNRYWADSQGVLSITDVLARTAKA